MLCLLCQLPKRSHLFAVRYDPSHGELMHLPPFQQSAELRAKDELQEMPECPRAAFWSSTLQRARTARQSQATLMAQCYFTCTSFISPPLKQRAFPLTAHLRKHAVLFPYKPFLWLVHLDCEFTETAWKGQTFIWRLWHCTAHHSDLFRVRTYYNTS